MPVAKPPTEPERPRAWVTERGGPAAAMDLGRAIPVTTYAIGLAVAGVLGLLVIVGALAYNSGRRSGQADTLKSLGLAGPGPVRDPLKNEPIPVNPNLLPRDAVRGPATPKPAGAEPRPPETSPAPAPSAGRIPDGTDPRTPGLNYLLIASKVDSETAERMVGFLNDNGVQAFRVAKGGAGAKNAGPWTVYALPGITPEQFKARTPERNQLQELVARVGKRWQREQKGQTDFATAYWEKYGS
jgi:hypothetical protein